MSPNKHWSTEQTILEYTKNITAPNVGRVCELFEYNSIVLVIMDKFNGQITESAFSLLDQHNIHARLLSPNTTDHPQPIHISINKPIKDQLRSQFSEWYIEQVLTQLDGEYLENLEDLHVELQPINLGMPAMKELGANWLVSRAQYISNNPHVVR